MEATSAVDPTIGLASSLGRIPGVVAVVLGGSRARGEERSDSDWDFGLYYRGSLRSIDPADVRALGIPGTVFAPGEWGTIVNGGAWLTFEGRALDLIYRDLDQVEHWLGEAEAGRFEVRREVGYVAGIATYVLAGELSVCRHLSGVPLPRPRFPDALRRSAPPWWRNVGAGALVHAGFHARRGDVAACVANVAQAALAAAQARVAERGEWTLNEKGLLHRAGLASAAAVLAHPGETAEELNVTVEQMHQLLDLPRWGR